MLRKIILGLLLLVVASVGNLYAQTFTTAEGYEFAIRSGSVEITSYSGNAQELEIPLHIEQDGKTYSVTSIADAAFSGSESLTSVIIPDSADSIEDDNALFSVISSSPDGIISIGARAFENCVNLTSVTIPDSVVSIGDSAFFNCENLTSIRMPSTATSIGERVFSGCSSLTSVTIPDGVISIGDSAFFNCESLTSIKIPSSVTSIGEGAFASCVSLTSIKIPSSVTSIGGGAFADCASLKSITIPDGITAINNMTFFQCTNLTSVIIPDSVVSIGDSAFFYCESLKSIELPNNVTSIGEMAFSGCQNLKSLTLPDSTTSIGKGAFEYCLNLKSIIIPINVISIGERAFYGCESLTLAIIPTSVTSIGDNAFPASAKFLVSQSSYAHKLAEQKSIPYSVVKPEVGKTYRTTDNLNIRQNEGMDGTPLFTLPKGEQVKILAQGKEATIDGIIANWLQIEVSKSTLSTKGREIEKGTVGWCFGGYVTITHAPSLRNPNALWLIGGAILLLGAMATVVIIIRKRSNHKNEPSATNPDATDSNIT